MSATDGVRGVVTVSASYGAGGSVLGPAVAERLGLPFFDRAIPVAVAERMAVPLEAAVDHDERTESGWKRALTTMAGMIVPMATTPLNETSDTETAFREQTETVLRQVADTTGGVVLGRAAMVVLGNRPDVLCVRLDGPPDERIARAAQAGGMDLAEARRLQESTDRARDTYARTLYGVRQDDPRQYHILLNSIVVPIETCIEIVVLAARARFASPGPAQPTPS